MMLATAPAPPKSKRRRNTLRMMLVLVACMALCAWAWRRTLESPSASIRRGSSHGRMEAISRLWQIPPGQARAAAPALFASLDDPDEQIRNMAVRALSHALREIDDPQDAARMAGPLIHALQNRDPEIRQAAALLLAEVHQSLKPPPTPSGMAAPIPFPSSVADALVAAFDDPNIRVPGAAYAAFRMLAKGNNAREAQLIAALLRAAKDQDAQVRTLAVSTMLSMGQASREVGLAVVRALNDPSPDVRAAAAVGEYQAPSTIPPPESVPDLVRALDGPSLATALKYLEYMGPTAKDALPALLAHLRPNADHVVGSPEVIRALGAVAPKSAEAKALVPSLIKCMKDRAGNPNDRVLIVAAMYRFRWDPEILAALRDLLSDPDPKIQSWANTLSNLPAEPEPNP